MGARTLNVWPLPVALLALAACVWLYWPGISGPTFLDDRSNVGVISNLLERPDAAADYVFGNRSGPLGRPVSMYSFVLEELYLQDGDAGRKRVNILLHVLNGALLMWLFSLLFGHARLPAHRWLAVLAAAAWLVTPLYVSTVLYVVQRMAILSTTFMLLACILYCYWRRVMFHHLLGWIVGVLLLACVALAALSKENGILVIAVIVLLEVLWFGGRDADGAGDSVLRRASLTLLWLGSAAALLGLLLGFEWIRDSYAYRNFTLGERLLTQARILWDYVGQLLWPELQRLGVFHDDYPLSTGLFTPRVTALAVFAWLLLVPACLLAVRRHTGRLMVCAVLLYLVPHTIESSVFALELYFEHRNYFPGIGIFLLLAAGLGSLGARWPPLIAPMLAWFAVYVLLLALQTGSQVQIWSSAPLLRLNNVNEHPNSFRANEEMALHLAGVGAVESALAYSRRANEVSYQERPGDRQIRDIALYCLAGRKVPAELFDTLGTTNPQRPFAVVSTVQGFSKVLQHEVCARADRIAFAERMAELFLGDSAVATASPNFYSVLAGMENDLQHFDTAYAYMNKVLELSPGNVRGMLMQLHFATALGKEQEAHSLVQQLLELREEGRLNIGNAKRWRCTYEAVAVRTAVRVRTDHRSLYALAGAVLLACILAYAAALHGPLFFDDVPNLLANHLLQIDGKSFDDWRVAALSSRSGVLLRPVAMLTFALNHVLAGSLSAFSLKATNLAIHLLIGAVVYLFALALLQAPALRAHRLDAYQCRLAALIAAAIWLLHPIHVSTVLYAVQRMTQLSTLFTLGGLVVFTRYRLRWAGSASGDGSGARDGAGAGEVLAAFLWLVVLGLFAVLSKENGALLPWLIAVVEVTLFRGIWCGKPCAPIKRLGWFALVLPVLGVIAVYIVAPELIVERFAGREFTLQERLLTQARALWQYLDWLLVPNILDMGFFHDDIPISRSLWSPVTTVLSLIAWAGVFIACGLWHRRLPLLAFAFLFYLVAHSMESTVWPLEMVFEHRNYLPSVGFALLAAVGILRGVAYVKGLRLQVVLVGILGILVVLLAVRTYSWRDELPLARFEVMNHPLSARANFFYANALFKRFEQARVLGLDENEKRALAVTSRQHFERMHIIDERGFRRTGDAVSTRYAVFSRTDAEQQVAGKNARASADPPLAILR